MKKAVDNNMLPRLLAEIYSEYFVMAPINRGGRLMVGEAEAAKDIDWSGKLTDNSWKEALLPAVEKIFEEKNGKLIQTAGVQPPIAGVAMNVLDLKALALWDLVFANDIYYQRRREKMLIVGYGQNWPDDYKKFLLFSHQYEEDVLEHVPFDIFISRFAGGRIIFHSQTIKGRQMLERSGITNFDNIEFAGAIPEEGPDKRMQLIASKMAKSEGDKLWRDLGEICLACGKCSINCPTCFCFDLRDKMNPEDLRRDRVRGNCFYNDFSAVAGGGKPLDTVKSKLYFWYTHKFLRIPSQYKVPGCVSCGRCTKACPVGIDVMKNIQTILKGK